MHVCVGHGFHGRFMKSLFNWFADFHLSWKLPARTSRRCTVTITHIPLYPGFSLFLEEIRKEHLDRVRAALQSYAAVVLLCCGTDVLFHPVGSLAEYTLRPACSFMYSHHTVNIIQTQHIMFRIYCIYKTDSTSQTCMTTKKTRMHQHTIKTQMFSPLKQK